VPDVGDGARIVVGENEGENTIIDAVRVALCQQREGERASSVATVVIFVPTTPRFNRNLSKGIRRFASASSHRNKLRSM
jgi:hypothetical protein